MPLSCPLCSAPLQEAELEAHLRHELLLPAYRCLLCPITFASRAEVDEHFRGPLSQHPGEKPQAMSLPAEAGKNERLLELLRLARGGPEAVQERLCVCGQCRLLCREQFVDKAAPLAQTEPRKHQYEPLDAFERDAWMPVEQTGSERTRQEQASTRIETSVNEIGVDQAPESSEEETPAPMDMKPSVAELKPELGTEGRVACLQCPSRVHRNLFSAHVQEHHMPGNPYQCLLCPQNAKKRSTLAQHLKAEHGAEMSPDTCTGAADKEAVKEWIHLCFGEATKGGYAQALCRPCNVQVRKSDVKLHISKMHLKKTMHKCRKCGHESTLLDKTTMNKHIRATHKMNPGTDTIDSKGADQFAPIVKAMIPQLFGL